MGLPFKIKKALFPRTRVINRTITQTSESSGLELGETDATAYRGDRGKTAYDYSQVGHIPSSYLDTDATMAANSDSKVATQKAGKAYSDAKVADAINNGTTTVAPSQNAVFDALALKLNVANPSITGNLQLSEDGGILFDQTLSADGSFSISKGELSTLGETLVFGELAYFKQSDSRWWKFDSDTESTSANVKLGIICQSGNAGDDRLIMLEGKIRADSQFPTLTVGAKVYGGSTAGAIQVAKPTTGFVRCIGFGNTADCLYFNPSNEHYELGVFSPVITFGGGSTGLTYNSQNGHFSKSMGRLFGRLFVQAGNKGSSTGPMVIGSMPYASRNATLNHENASLYVDNANAIGVPSGLNIAGNATIELYQMSTAGAISTITDATATNTIAVRASISYLI